MLKYYYYLPIFIYVLLFLGGGDFCTRETIKMIYGFMVVSVVGFVHLGVWFYTSDKK